MRLNLCNEVFFDMTEATPKIKCEFLTDDDLVYIYKLRVADSFKKDFECICTPRSKMRYADMSLIALWLFFAIYNPEYVNYGMGVKKKLKAIDAKIPETYKKWKKQFKTDEKGNYIFKHKF